MITIGSPKQIAWAARIKIERMNSWRLSDSEAYTRVEASLNSQKSAAWWITHRDKSFGEILKFLQGEGGVKSSAKAITRDAIASLPVLSASPRSPVANNDALYRFVGESRSILTGEVVVDPACPF